MSTSVPVAPTTSPSIDLDRAIDTLVVAFSSDPIIRWFMPEGSRYLAHFPRLLTVLAEPSVRQAGSVDGIGAFGAALWHGPGTETDDELLADLVQAAVEPPRHEATFGFLTAMAEHHPTEPHWYLPFIGVDPAHQGHGYGSRLLEIGLARCDRDGLPAYLEASSPRNRPLYERHGFVAFAEVRAGDSPPMWPMLRPAR